MGLFGRNKNDEKIEELNNKINEVNDDFIEFKKETNDTVKDLEKKTKDSIRNLNKEMEKDTQEIKGLFEQFDKILLNLNSRVEDMEELINNINSSQQKIIESIGKNPEKTKKKVKKVPKIKKESQKIVSSNEMNDGHIFHFKVTPQPYGNISLRGDKLISATGEMSFNIKDIIGIKENLQKYHDLKYPAIKIGEKHNIHRGTIARVIWNIEEGKFDDLIEEYRSTPKSSNEKRSLQIAKGYQVPYKYTIDNNGKLYMSTGKQLPYNIEDIIKFKKELEEANDDELKDVINKFPYSKGTGHRVAWNIFEGNFDELINEWELMQSGEIIKQENSDEKTKHFRKVPKSLHKPLSKKMELIDGGVIYNNRWGRSLPFTIQEILDIQEKIPDFNKYPTFESIAEDYDISLTTVKTLIWRIEEGYFDDLIEEYLSRNYTYENNFNRLFIDGVNTGLSIDKAISIVECIINEPNRQECTNKLIKMYPTVESKYIRIISDNYNNPNLGKVLKKEVKKVNKIDNPQKRKEAGVFL